MGFRTENDFLGSVRVPADAYFGGFTVRAAETFQISPWRAPPRFIQSLLQVKKACAQANVELGLLDPKKAKAILQAADEALLGKYREEFILDAFQAGAGTPYNMNANEVLANRATEILGGKKGQYAVHPNNDINAAQSSNDVIPTATRVAILYAHQDLDRQAQLLASSFAQKAKRFSSILKTGRTHLQDAVPITLGQEFSSYASAIERSRKRMLSAADALKEIPLGGTALGTGINTTEEFPPLACKKLSHLCGFTLQIGLDLVELEQNHNDFLNFSQSLALLSADLVRICGNLKLLSSGPKGGFSEIMLPEVEPGSSIMPGKVNPSVCEAVEMTAFHALGSARSVELCVLSAPLDLNTNTPLIAFEILNSTFVLTNACRILREKCVDGIRADEARAKSVLENTTACATALNRLLGYSTVSKIVQEAVKKNKPLRQVVLERKLLSLKELDALLSPENLTRPNLKSKKS